MSVLTKQDSRGVYSRTTGSGAECLSLRGVTVRLLALELGEHGDAAYQVSFRSTPGAMFHLGLMKHIGGESWDVIEGHTVSCANLAFGSLDEVFSLALGESGSARQALKGKVQEALPHWPTAFVRRLARTRLSGAGTIAFDADWFLSKMATSAFDRPLLFPNAASKLGLAGLMQAGILIKEIADSDLEHEEAPESTLARGLLRALNVVSTKDDSLEWDGDGRLVGAYASGEHGQLGSDIGEGCRAALGVGPLHVLFDPAEPLGLGLGPLHPSQSGAFGSAGMGAEVGEVDAQGAAERAGVLPGMVLSRFSQPELTLSEGGRSVLPFRAVLHELDQRRAAGLPLGITFETAAPVTQLYAVEMPAEATLTALGVAFGCRAADYRLDAALGAALPSSALLWREETPRLFLGEAGSVTCAHTDLCPQLEMAHALLGVKVLGVASHHATPRLSTEHGEDCDEEATRIPTDRPLTSRQSRLLGDTDVTLALLQEGDLAVFDSGALHFASNGDGGLSGALYHGILTAAAVPRLRLAAALPSGSHSSSDGDYSDHLLASDLLEMVEPLLGRHAGTGSRDR